MTYRDREQRLVWLSIHRCPVEMSEDITENHAVVTSSDFVESTSLHEDQSRVLGLRISMYALFDMLDHRIKYV